MGVYVSLHTIDVSIDGEPIREVKEVSYKDYARASHKGWVPEEDPLAPLAVAAFEAEREMRRARVRRENVEMAARIRRIGRRRAGLLFSLPTRAG